MVAIVVHVFPNLYDKDDEGSRSGCDAAIDRCDRNSSQLGACECTLPHFLLLMLWHPHLKKMP